MRKLILLFALLVQTAVAQFPAGGGNGGGGFTAPGAYSWTITGLTTDTKTAAVHRQGTMPEVGCWQTSTGEKVLPQILNPSFLGDITVNFGAAFTGVCLIAGPGVNTGAAGDVVGPSSSTSGCVAYFSGTSGKIITCAPTGLFYDSANVRLGVGTGTPQGNLDVRTSIAAGRMVITDNGGLLQLGAVDYGFTTTAPMRIQGTNLRFFTNPGTATEAVRIVTSGNTIFGGSTFTDGNYKLDVQASGSTGTLRAFNQAVGGSTLAVVQAGDTQSGNLLSVRNNAGTELAYIDNTGSLVGSSIFVAAGGGFSFVGRSVIASPADGVLRLTNNAGTDFNRVQLGGTTSSFPALKRSSATLQVRLADDSAFATLDMGIPKFSGTNSTGAGSALLGANSPASTLTAPYTWITVVTADGSTAYIPAWK